MKMLSNSFKRKAAGWLRQGMSPRQLALTLALGFAIGCIPVMGIPTLLCAVLALLLGLNQPAIQAANYAAMPLQIVLILPFVRLGEKLLGFGPVAPMTANTAMHMTLWSAGSQLGVMAGSALLAWMLVAGPAVALITVGLTAMLRRIPALSEL